MADGEHHPMRRALPAIAISAAGLTWLLNAQHMHNVPGRKTDVADSVWIAQLIEHGLVRPSFIPPAPVRDLRDLTRLRTAITQERTRAI